MSFGSLLSIFSFQFFHAIFYFLKQKRPRWNICDHSKRINQGAIVL